MTYQLHHGNMLEILPMMERDSIDAVICDPPYGLDFMGKDWDHGVPGEHFWREVFRVAKPGAMLLAFGGTRTHHRLMVAIEDAGWELRDTIMYLYGSGFPKSHDVSKAIDREAGAEREVIGRYARPDGSNQRKSKQGYQSDYVMGDSSTCDMEGESTITSPATPAAAEWDGWGTALKPAWEPVIVARKPLQGTVAENVQRFGTGGINVDAGRVEHASEEDRVESEHKNQYSHYSNPGSNADMYEGGYGPRTDYHSPQGRWPANLIHDGSEEVLAGFPVTTSGARVGGDEYKLGRYEGQRGARGLKIGGACEGSTGSAARFFYCAKASKADRDEGCEGLEERVSQNAYGDFEGTKEHATNVNTKTRNNHPTVKPTSLMRYLCKLVTPPGGVILDPFMGSGSTGKAAMLEGFNFVGVDTEIEYVEIAARRIEHACGKVGIIVEQPMMFNTRQTTPCPECNGTGIYTFVESFNDWIAKTKDYGGAREEWERLSSGNGESCQNCQGAGKVQRQAVDVTKQMILL